MTDSTIDQFVDKNYDSETDELTIFIDRRLLVNKNSQEALVDKCLEIMRQNPIIKRIHIEPRQ